jgi:hypothetical protein
VRHDLSEEDSTARTTGPDRDRGRGARPDQRYGGERRSRDLAIGRVVRTITDPNFDTPTTIAFFGPFTYAVSARLTTTATPDTTHTVVRVP